MRQSGLARGKRGMEVEIDRAERHLRELEQTEADLVKQLEGDAEPAKEEPAAHPEEAGAARNGGEAHE